MQTLESGQLSYGPLSLAFEQRFAAAHGNTYGILANSGTSALVVAVQALKICHGWEDGDQIIVPATTFVATPNAVLLNRLEPVFVDVDAQTYNLDPALIAPAVTDRTRAVLPVSLFGQPADLETIGRVAIPLGLKVIHDSCETAFVTHHGRPLGYYADVTCFSFYAAHLLVTGVGGMALTDSPGYAATMRSLVNHGLEVDALNPGENFSPRPTPGRRFRFAHTGHSFRITELEAALGLAGMDDMPQALLLRARNARHLSAGLALLNGVFGNIFQLPYAAYSHEHAWMMYPIVIRRGDKESLMRHLNECGIETRDMLPLLDQPAFRHVDRAPFPVSENLIANGFYVGVHQDLSVEDIGYMVDVFGLWCEEQGRRV